MHVIYDIYTGFEESIVPIPTRPSRNRNSLRCSDSVPRVEEFRYFQTTHAKFRVDSADMAESTMDSA